MLDYDTEAGRYDATRGGEARALAAATALDALLPATGVIADIGGGTGIVSRHLATPTRTVIVADASTGMLTLAARRLPGRAVRADATRLPFADASLHAVTCIWLLHLLPPHLTDAVITEAARVLAPGGILAATIGKNNAHQGGDDTDAILHRVHQQGGAPHIPSDDPERLAQVTATRGLTPQATTTFTGHGQGRTPNNLAYDLADGRHLTWLPHLTQTDLDAALADLAALPGPDVPRTDPVYTLASWRR
ncbi:class I SAM-dependent methyltransferase [Actinorhabdospora filicis]|uniref:class I SAM-dependent methyltransferase n=1 Tax=Actinorhabdospora filicis TaxID=1785913 RepID=UPI00255337D3|nr:class I SAM-dependent methyltransferase [Actinorhabdospora filicis]